MRSVCRLVGVAIAVILFLAGENVVAQQVQEQDVVYLKDGSILRGTIVEQVPDVSIKLRTADGSVFVKKMSEILKFAKEPVVGGAPNMANDLMKVYRYKEPGTATMYGIICPGCGHLWTGESKKGALLLGVGVLAPIVGSAMTSCDYSGCSSGPLVAGLLGAGGAWIYGIIDAPKSAERMNEMRGLKMTLDARDGRYAAGVRVAVGF